jgi:hypothetical protein
MACIENVTVCITQGNNWNLDITVSIDGAVDPETGEVLNPKDITGATIDLTLKEIKEGTVIITPTASIVDAVNGQISFSLTPAETESLIVEPSETGTRKLFGAPQITYADGTIEDLFDLVADIHQSWN